MKIKDKILIINKRTKKRTYYMSETTLHTYTGSFISDLRKKKSFTKTFSLYTLNKSTNRFRKKF